MNNELRIQAKTVDEALEVALQQLEVSREDVDIQVLEEPKKGFLGIGAKDALVLFTLKKQLTTPSVEEQVLSKDEAINNAKSFLSNVLDKMGLHAEIDVVDTEENVLFTINGEQMGLVIGRRGQTLDALQYLTNIVINKRLKDRLRIVLDTEDYRKRRKITLQSLADRLSMKVMRTQQKIVLEPMSPGERKIIHTHLQELEGVTTKSEGKEPHRRVVVYPE